MPRLYVYYVVHDKGVAPNPEGGLLTLALCKVQIRKSAVPGDIIIGLVAKGLAENVEHKVKENSICYCAKITRKISLDEYDMLCSSETKLSIKTPNFTTEEDFIKSTMLEHSTNIIGDNIKISNADGIILRHYAHSIEGLNAQIEDDLNCPNVLCSDDFYYFGEKAIDLGTNQESKKWYDSFIKPIFDSDLEKKPTETEENCIEENKSNRRGHRVAYFDNNQTAQEFFERFKKIAAIHGIEHGGKIAEPVQDFRKHLLSSDIQPLPHSCLLKIAKEIEEKPIKNYQVFKPKPGSKIITRNGIEIFQRKRLGSISKTVIKPPLKASKESRVSRIDDNVEQTTPSTARSRSAPAGFRRNNF